MPVQRANGSLVADLSPQNWLFSPKFEKSRLLSQALQSVATGQASQKDRRIVLSSSTHLGPANLGRLLPRKVERCLTSLFKLLRRVFVAVQRLHVIENSIHS